VTVHRIKTANQISLWTAVFMLCHKDFNKGW